MRKAVAGTVLGAAAARVAYTLLTRRPPREEKLWLRTNHRGEPVTLLEGPAFVAGAVTAVAVAPGVPARMRMAAVFAGTAAGALGAYDDLAGSGDSRGFKGHLSALARGQVTTGAVKILGIGATGLAAAALAGTGRRRSGRRSTRADLLINGALVAGCANLLNLFDLRPGRAIKVGALAALPGTLSGSAVTAAPLGAALALLPEDLGERAMLGDAGANALGALLGLSAAHLPRPVRLGILTGVVALNAASEFVSFTKVIQATPALRWLDQLGRRPVVPEARPTGTE
jgi:UDP-N-acetylmuramyl pentapeptide phosphotransferase/UDP-N-acetylglucosamine-1-phosphate transferase